MSTDVLLPSYNEGTKVGEVREGSGNPSEDPSPLARSPSVPTPTPTFRWSRKI